MCLTHWPQGAPKGGDLEKGRRHLAVRKPAALLDLGDSAKRNRSKKGLDKGFDKRVTA